MKKMIYYTEQKRIILDSGSNGKYKYYILNLGTHPTAYVQIPKGDKYYKKPNLAEEDIIVHGGITYTKDTLRIGPRKEISGWFIGWDYAHCEDYYGAYPEYIDQSKQHKWKTSEIKYQVALVCSQLESGNKVGILKRLYYRIFRR